MTSIIEMLLFPPGINVAIAVVALALLKYRRRTAVLLLMLDTALLYAMSLPLTAAALMSALQSFPALTLQDVKDGKAQAIVVLGAGRYAGAPEYGGDTLSRFELERLRYGVHLQRLSGLPLMLVGGTAASEAGRVPESLLMKAAAENDFGATVAWTEERSHTTAENARYAAAILREHGIHHIYLVSHAWHMPRAMLSFQQAGIEATPAPTAFVTSHDGGPGRDWLPSARALYKVSLALHEIAGLQWYRLTSR